MILSFNLLQAPAALGLAQSASHQMKIIILSTFDAKPVIWGAREQVDYMNRSTWLVLQFTDIDGMKSKLNINDIWTQNVKKGGWNAVKYFVRRFAVLFLSHSYQIDI